MNKCLDVYVRLVYLYTDVTHRDLKIYTGHNSNNLQKPRGHNFHNWDTTRLEPTLLYRWVGVIKLRYGKNMCRPRWQDKAKQ